MADEACARFVFDNSVVRSDGSVRWKAFLDKRPPHDTSVSLHAAVGENIHWDEGARVNPSRSLLGAADLPNDAVAETGLGLVRWGQHQYQNADVSMWEAFKFVETIEW